MLYEMATGVHPFRRATTLQTMSAIVDDEARPIDQLNGAVPTMLRWVIERCLAKDPADRYAIHRRPVEGPPQPAGPARRNDRRRHASGSGADEVAPVARRSSPRESRFWLFPSRSWRRYRAVGSRR